MIKIKTELLICPNCGRLHEVLKDDNRSLELQFKGNSIALSCLHGDCIKTYGHDINFGMTTSCPKCKFIFEQSIPNQCPICDISLSRCKIVDDGKGGEKLIFDDMDC